MVRAETNRSRPQGPEGATTTMAMAPQQLGIGIDGTSRRRTSIRTTRSSGSAATRGSPTSRTAATPSSRPTSSSRRRWSLNATNIVAQKYFRGTLGTPEREWSLRQVIDRVADTITDWGVRDGYFVDDDEAEAFRDELKYVLVHQRAAFNSPVWFNIGVKGVPQQASACFILAVDDTMDAILNWYREEGVIFKGGSGAGINLSRHPLVAGAPEGRRHRVGSGELHARRRRVGRHDQVGRQDPARGQDGDPRRRPPRHRRVRLVQGDRGAQGAGAARRRLRHGPRRQATATRSSTRTRTTRCASPTTFMQAVVDDRDWDLKAVTDGDAGQDDEGA